MTTDPAAARRPSQQLCESAFAVALNGLPASLESARTIAHDTVILNTGRARLSGVTWAYYPAWTAAADLAAEGLALPRDAVALCGLYPNGVLVMATVAVDEKVQP